MVEARQQRGADLIYRGRQGYACRYRAGEPVVELQHCSCGFDKHDCLVKDQSKEEVAMKVVEQGDSVEVSCEVRANDQTDTTSVS